MQRPPSSDPTAGVGENHDAKHVDQLPVPVSSRLPTVPSDGRTHDAGMESSENGEALEFYDDFEIVNLDTPSERRKSEAANLLRQLKENKQTAQDEIERLTRTEAELEAFLGTCTSRFPIKYKILRAALLAIDFISKPSEQPKQRHETKKPKIGDNRRRIRCDVSHRQMTLTTSNDDLFCSVQIALEANVTPVSEQPLSFRMVDVDLYKYFVVEERAKGAHYFGKGFPDLLDLGYNDKTNVLSIPFREGPIVLATRPASEEAAPEWSNESFGPPIALASELLGQALQAVRMSTEKKGAPGYRVVDISAGRARGAAINHVSIFEHAALADLDLQFRSEDLPSLIRLLSRFSATRTHLRVSPHWYRISDGTIDLMIRRTRRPLVYGVDKKIAEAVAATELTFEVDREGLLQCLTRLNYLLPKNELRGSYSFSVMAELPPQVEKRAKLKLEVASRDFPGMRVQQYVDIRFDGKFGSQEGANEPSFFPKPVAIDIQFFKKYLLNASTPSLSISALPWGLLIATQKDNSLETILLGGLQSN